MREEKTRLTSLKNQDWTKVNVENEKVNEVLQHIPTDCIAKLNKLIYVGAKLVND